jgi:hypothetical protein
LKSVPQEQEKQRGEFQQAITARDAALDPRLNGSRPPQSNTFTDAYILGHVIYRVMTSESSVGNHAV